MKFAEVIKGTRAEREIDLPGVLTRNGNPVPLLIRPLNDAEDVEVLRLAADTARTAGGDGLREDPIYQRTMMVQTILLGCLDKDSPADAREPFFASESQISRALDRDSIAMLYEKHQAFQREVSPLKQDLSGPELYERIATIAVMEANDDPFVELAPGTRWGLARTMARLLLDSPGLKSHFGLLSPTSAMPASSGAS